MEKIASALSYPGETPQLAARVADLILQQLCVTWVHGLLNDITFLTAAYFDAKILFEICLAAATRSGDSSRLRQVLGVA